MLQIRKKNIPEALEIMQLIKKIVGEKMGRLMKRGMILGIMLD